MKYLFIDTNIWLRFITQGKPGCELEHFKFIKSEIDEGNIKLLLPEVVKFEIDKKYKTFQEKAVKAYNYFSGGLTPLYNDKNLWNEIHDLREAVTSNVNAHKDAKCKMMADNKVLVDNLLIHKNADDIPYTMEIEFQAKKRKLKGKVPNDDENPHADLCIIESLSSYLKDAPKGSVELCICTENVKDFGIIESGAMVIHQCFDGDLPAATKCFTNLSDLHKFYESAVPIQPPTPEVVEEGRKKILRRGRSTSSVLRRIGVSVRKGECVKEACESKACSISALCYKHHMDFMNTTQLSVIRFWWRKLNILLKEQLSTEGLEILRIRNGFTRRGEHSVENIATHMSISEQRVNQLIRKYISVIKEPGLRDHIIEYSLAYQDVS